MKKRLVAASLTVAVGLVIFYSGEAAGRANDGRTTARALYAECFKTMREGEIKLLQKGRQFAADWARKWEHRGANLKNIEEAELACSQVAHSLGELHDDYWPPDERRQYEESAKSELVGIGAEMTLKGIEELVKTLPKATGRANAKKSLKVSPEHPILVVQPIEGGPAEQSGIQAGDAILAVDGRSTTGVSYEEIIFKWLRGTAGSAVRLTVGRTDQDGRQETKQIVVTRARVTLHPVRAKEIEDRGLVFGHVRLSTFSSELAVPEMKGALNRLKAARDRGGKVVLILDLRDNGGGREDFALQILEMLMREGTLQERLIRDGNTLWVEKEILHEHFTHKLRWRADQPEAYQVGEGLIRERQIIADDVPIIVLVNEQSASASEIVAGTLKAQRRNVWVCCDTSFGKTVGQGIHRLSNGGAMKVTGFEFRPGGVSIDGVGVTPDFKLDAKKEGPAGATDPKPEDDPELEYAKALGRALVERQDADQQEAARAKSRNETRNNKLLKKIDQALNQ